MTNRITTATKLPLRWERQSGETSRQFAAFKTYRNLDPLHRSLAKVAQQLGYSETYVQRLSSRHQWIERTDAFDAAEDRADQMQRGRRIQEMQKRQAAVSETALEKVKEGLANLDPHSLRPNEIARLLEVASRTERVARGVLPDEPPVYEPGRVASADAIRALLKAEGLLRG